MKKVGIVTIYDRVPNYGNRLQNYAVQCILESLDLDVCTYCFEGKTISYKDIVKHMIHVITRYKLASDKFIWTYEYKRKKAFDNFNKRFIHTVYKNKITKQLKLEQDFFVVGSDQVWNPNWYDNNPLKKDAFLLTFADSDQKICFAPSFGVDELPEEWTEWFTNNLSTFQSINVREQSGVELIKKLTGSICPIIPDPTMILEKREWLRIANT